MLHSPTSHFFFFSFNYAGRAPGYCPGGIPGCNNYLIIYLLLYLIIHRNLLLRSVVAHINIYLIIALFIDNDYICAKY